MRKANKNIVPAIDSISLYGGVENTRYFYHGDHLGSSSWITDKDGNALQYISYLPYGQLFMDLKTTSYDASYKFIGKERDTETGFDYFGARYYSNSLGVWLSVDPLAEKFYSTSPYMFCLGNPLRLVDYNGMDTILFNSRGEFGKPFGGGDNGYDTYVKVNTTEFSENKINYNKNGELRNRHSSMNISDEFYSSHKPKDSDIPTTDVYSMGNYFEAKEIFEFFADNTAVEWAHQILQNNDDGSYLNIISTTHKVDEVNLPGIMPSWTPIDTRHSHLPGYFFSKDDKDLHTLYKSNYVDKIIVTRIYKGGIYTVYDNIKEYTNLNTVPSYK